MTTRTGYGLPRLALVAGRGPVVPPSRFTPYRSPRDRATTAADTARTTE
ncbi:hypothetical protein HEP87_19815 [Streptomyces sp. S1D4-11]|nr:hypothetical protein [Streptomyces sp. S1D4-11]QIY95868.1 hypothetical protein HEP87_19815 [Streptomyces sp. S1D4-11]